MLKTHTNFSKNVAKHFGGGCKGQRPFACKKFLYTIDRPLMITNFIPGLVKNQTKKKKKKKKKTIKTKIIGRETF